MIKASHKPFFVWFFRVYTSLNLRLHFSRVVIEGDTGPAEGRSILLIGNHFSWWDGFFALWLNERVWRLKFHVMMLEEQLSGRMFLNKTGAYSIRKGSRSVIDSLNYTSQLLSVPGNLVVMYPQGEIESQYINQVKFERGIERILRSVRGSYSIFFYTALVDWYSAKKPALTIRIKKYKQDGPADHASIEAAFNEHLEASIALQKPSQQ